MSERTIISFDYAIKTVLRDKANFDILEGFLSELLGKQITILALLESEGNAEIEGAKTNRVDLKAKIDDGEMAIIELQFADQVDFFGKILYSASKAIVEQIPKGGKYDIKKIYSINIVYFELGAKQDYIFHADMLNFNGIHFKEQIPFSQNDNLAPPPCEKNHIHPEYYLILPNKFDEQIKDGIDEWVYVFKKSAVKDGFKAKGIKEAGIKLDELKMTKTQKAAYEKFLMDKQSVDSAMWTAEMKGRAAGREEGREESILQIAKKLKAKSMDINDIAETTGLSTDDILLL